MEFSTIPKRSFTTPLEIMASPRSGQAIWQESSQKAGIFWAPLKGKINLNMVVDDPIPMEIFRWINNFVLSFCKSYLAFKISLVYTAPNEWFEHSSVKRFFLTEPYKKITKSCKLRPFKQKKADARRWSVTSCCFYSCVLIVVLTKTWNVFTFTRCKNKEFVHGRHSLEHAGNGKTY